MKKFFAVLLAAVMLLSMTAVAEEIEEVEGIIEVTDSVEGTLDEDQLLNFDILMDKLPEGYEMIKVPVDGSLYAFFGNDNADIVYYVSVAPDEMFDGYTMVLADLNAEEYANAIAYIGAADDFVNPEFSFTKTAYGTDVIIVNEADDDSDDEVELISIYEGYIITMSIVKNEPITDEDIAAALQLLSDMWIVGVGQ